MHVIETNDPLHGAAYRVLYESVLPFNCATRERKAEIEEEFARINAWAAMQGPKVFESYKWATAKMSAELERSVSTNETGRKVNEAFASIPKPPSRSE